MLCLTQLFGYVAADLIAAQAWPLQSFIEPFVNSNEIAGAVCLVGDRNGNLHIESIGFASLEDKRPMMPETLFWIASMTKPMTAVAIMQLAETGRLNIDDPVEKYLPEFQNQRMILREEAGQLVLTKPPRAITIRDLLTHTSGLGDVPPPRPNVTLAEMVMAYAREPLRFPPGTRWAYSNSGINTLGRIVEIVSGVPFPEYMQRFIFEPLGMSHTTFWPSVEQQKQLATAYRRTDSGKLEPTGIYFLQGRLEDRSRTPWPAGGLFSTAVDVYRFYLCMLKDGRLGDVHILKPESVQQMRMVQTGELETGFVPGMAWGLGFAVVQAPQGITGMLSSGTFGHGGAYGTQSWADPQKGLVYILMVQRANFPNSDASPVRRAFQEAAAAAFAR